MAPYNSKPAQRIRLGGELGVPRNILMAALTALAALAAAACFNGAPEPAATPPPAAAPPAAKPPAPPQQEQPPAPAPAPQPPVRITPHAPEFIAEGTSANFTISASRPSDQPLQVRLSAGSGIRFANGTQSTVATIPAGAITAAVELHAAQIEEDAADNIASSVSLALDGQQDALLAADTVQVEIINMIIIRLGALGAGQGTVQEGQQAAISITASRPVPADVDLFATITPNLFNSQRLPIRIPRGATSGTFMLDTGPVDADEQISIAIQQLLREDMRYTLDLSAIHLLVQDIPETQPTEAVVVVDNTPPPPGGQPIPPPGGTIVVPEQDEQDDRLEQPDQPDQPSADHTITLGLGSTVVPEAGSAMLSIAIDPPFPTARRLVLRNSAGLLGAAHYVHLAANQTSTAASINVAYVSANMETQLIVKGAPASTAVAGDTALQVMQSMPGTPIQVTAFLSAATVAEGSATVFTLSLDRPFADPVQIIIKDTEHLLHNPSGGYYMLTIPAGALSASAELPLPHVAADMDTFIVLQGLPDHCCTVMGDLDLTVLNRDLQPTASLSAPSVSEGATATIALSIDRPLAAPFSVRVHDSAGLVADPAGAPLTITIPAGATAASVGVRLPLVTEDRDTAITFSGLPANCCSVMAELPLTITNSHTRITAAIAPNPVTEGGSAKLSITLDQPLGEDAVVTVRDSAGILGDEDGAFPLLRIGAQDLAAAIDLPILFQPADTATVITLEGLPANCCEVNGDLTLSVTDRTLPITASLERDTIDEGQPLLLNISIPQAQLGGIAVSGSAGGTPFFAVIHAGYTSTQIDITPDGTDSIDGDLTGTVSLSPGIPNCCSVSPASLNYTVRDLDLITLSLPAAAPEGSDVPLSVALRRPFAADGAVLLTDSRGVLGSISVPFAAGQSTATVALRLPLVPATVTTQIESACCALAGDLSLRIDDRRIRITAAIAPNPVTEGGSAKLSITLDQPLGEDAVVTVRDSAGILGDEDGAFPLLRIGAQDLAAAADLPILFQPASIDTVITLDGLPANCCTVGGDLTLSVVDRNLPITASLERDTIDEGQPLLLNISIPQAQLGGIAVSGSAGGTAFFAVIHAGYTSAQIDITPDGTDSISGDLTGTVSLSPGIPNCCSVSPASLTYTVRDLDLITLSLPTPSAPEGGEVPLSVALRRPFAADGAVLLTDSRGILGSISVPFSAGQATATVALRLPPVPGTVLTQLESDCCALAGDLSLQIEDRQVRVDIAVDPSPVPEGGTAELSVTLDHPLGADTAVTVRDAAGILDDVDGAFPVLRIGAQDLAAAVDLRVPFLPASTATALTLEGLPDGCCEVAGDTLLRVADSPEGIVFTASLAESEIDEGGALLLRLDLSSPAPSPLSIQVSGSDVQPAVINIPAGAGAVLDNVALLTANHNADFSGAVELTVLTPNCCSVSPASLPFTVRDLDQVQFQLRSSSVEEDSQAELTISLRYPLQRDLTLTITDSGQILEGAQEGAHTVTIPAGQTSVTATLSIPFVPDSSSITLDATFQDAPATCCRIVGDLTLNVLDTAISADLSIERNPLPEASATYINISFDRPLSSAGTLTIRDSAGILDDANGRFPSVQVGPDASSVRVPIRLPYLSSSVDTRLSLHGLEPQTFALTGDTTLQAVDSDIVLTARLQDHSVREYGHTVLVISASRPLISPVQITLKDSAGLLDDLLDAYPVATLQRSALVFIHLADVKRTTVTDLIIEGLPDGCCTVEGDLRLEARYDPVLVEFDFGTDTLVGGTSVPVTLRFSRPQAQLDAYHITSPQFPEAGRLTQSAIPISIGATTAQAVVNIPAVGSEQEVQFQVPELLYGCCRFVRNTLRVLPGRQQVRIALEGKNAPEFSAIPFTASLERTYAEDTHITIRDDHGVLSDAAGNFPSIVIPAGATQASGVFRLGPVDRDTGITLRADELHLQLTDQTYITVTNSEVLSIALARSDQGGLAGSVAPTELDSAEDIDRYHLRVPRRSGAAITTPPPVHRVTNHIAHFIYEVEVHTLDGTLVHKTERNDFRPSRGWCALCSEALEAGDYIISIRHHPDERYYDTLRTTYQILVALQP